MRGPADRGRVVSDEQAANARYFEILDRQDRSRIETQGSRSTFWTGTGRGRAPTLPRGPLIGRVALDAPNEFVDGASEYYIGARKTDANGLLVFSWAAPIACTFFRGVDDYPLFDRVVAIRTLLHSPAAEVVDLSDELLDPQLDEAPFARRELRVPAPPKSAAGNDETAANVMVPTVRVLATASPDVDVDTSSEARPPSLRGALARRAPELRPELHRTAHVPLRAPDALRSALEAPRTQGLTSVLSTLQPDQYDVVTRSIHEPLVVQGHPGSGKTIVAAHRAAYLLHPESGAVADRAPGDQVRHVLLVGPTPGHTQHVIGALDGLGVDRDSVDVLSLEQFLARLRGVRIPPLELRGPAEKGYRDVDQRLFALAGVAALGVDHSATTSETTTKIVYDRLRTNSTGDVPVTTDGEWSPFLTALPEWSTARTERHLHPLLAACAIQAGANPHLHAYDHVIVDEAQDVRPLEWALLDRVNVGGRWTIVGDINQRRSDYSFHSWGHLIAQLGLTAHAGPVEPVVMRRGYRSTGPIMRFANELVPKADRQVDTFREEGTEPAVDRVDAKSLLGFVADRIVDYAVRYADGTVAAITVDPTSLRRELAVEGWSAERAGAKWWHRDTLRVWVGHPDAARGLEFDAVVVVEPADFPLNLGRHGLLYTSLTRANKELTVAHSRTLPGGLRPPHTRHKR